MVFPIPPRQDQYLQGQQCSSGYIAICRGEQIVWILNLSTPTPFPRCGPNTLTLALGVPAQHLLLVSKFDHLQDFSTPDTQVLATPTPGLGIGVNHHLCLNHNLTFKLGEHHVNMLKTFCICCYLGFFPRMEIMGLGYQSSQDSFFTPCSHLELLSKLSLSFLCLLDLFQQLGVCGWQLL